MTWFFASSVSIRPGQIALMAILGPSSLARARHAKDAGFGRGVGKAADRRRDTARQRVQGGDGGDPPAALREHQRRRGVDVVEAAFQVDRDRAVILILGNVEDALGLRLAGIVQQEVNAAEGGLDFGHNLSGAREVRGIGLEAQDAPAQRLDLAARSVHLFRQQVDQRDVEALSRKGQGAAAPNAPGTTGDNGGSRGGHTALSLHQAATSTWLANQQSPFALAAAITFSSTGMRLRWPI
jgi:hypothetical protein